MRNVIIATVALAALAACGKTEDGRVTVERPGDVNVTTTTDTLGRIPQVQVGTEKDTITVPTVTTKKEVITKPTVHTKP